MTSKSTIHIPIPIKIPRTKEVIIFSFNFHLHTELWVRKEREFVRCWIGGVGLRYQLNKK